MKRAAILAGFLLSSALAAADGRQVVQAHDKTWWRAVVENDFAPPRAAPLAPLVRELCGYLGVPDPELRDGIAYQILTQWLYVQRIVSPELRRELIGSWRANLERGIGERGTDSVLLRSFSALMLSVAVALDNEEPYLDEAEFERLLDSSLTYLRNERDTRGFDAGRGWMHSVAHTADLLKFLGRSRHLEIEDQATILTAIAGKLDRIDHVLAYGEDERLARAILSILARPDVDEDAAADFLERLRPRVLQDAPTPEALAVNQNRRHVAISLHALLAVDGRDFETLAEARERVTAFLRTIM